ncbi:hypothetical protein ABZS86_02340 [Streptomyces sp. NPDC005355]|uniref:hypothetical protein n=1 Tax=Streptomyces sp. NPDC005355 TaxID=3157038 RepID=UPI0033AB1F77
MTASATGRPRPTGQGRPRRALMDNPYGLTLPELKAEMRRCAASGWQLWEIRRRFIPTRKDGK